MLAVTTWILAAGGTLAEGGDGDDTLTATGEYNRLYVCPASALPAAPDIVLPQGGNDDDTLTAPFCGGFCYGSRLYVCPASALPAAPDIVLPQGGDGNDVLNVAGELVVVDVCPASALSTAPNLVFFRRAATATTIARNAASSPS
jgi:Ca2+-binding RTX toxin-like protein